MTTNIYTYELDTMEESLEMVARIAFNFKSGETKLTELRVGDNVEELRYVKGNEILSVSGKITKINAEPKYVRNTTTSSLPTISSFDLMSIEIDCSSSFNSDIKTIAIDSIRDIASPLTTEFPIDEIDILNVGTLQLKTSNTIKYVIWNNIISTFATDSATNITSVILPTMNVLNEITIIDTNNNVRSFFMTGITPDCELNHDIENDMMTKVANLVDTHYNAHIYDENVSIDDSDYYIQIASGISFANSITVNNIPYTATQYTNLSIGNNSFINKPLFKIVNGILYLAAPIMSAIADNTGKLTITVNGFVIDIVIGSVVGTDIITLDSVVPVGDIEGYENTATLVIEDDGSKTVTHTRQHGRSSLGFLLNVNGTPVVEDTIMMTKKVYPETGQIRYGIIRSLDEPTYTESVFNYYSNEPIAAESTRAMNYTIRIPNTGSISFNINFVETVKLEEIITE